MNNTLRTFIRFAIILVFLILLVFLSITLFKLIPKGINQLATASLSLTGLENKATTTSITEDRIPQPVATTTGGLNGVISTPIETVKKTYSYTAPRTVYYPTQSGLKNIKVSLLSTGIIDKYSGQFINTNSFNTNDVVSIRYKVENTSDTNIGSFGIRVDMPAANYADRTRYVDLDLPAYSAYQVEARFDGINTSVSPIVRIYADINNSVSEINESDNTLSITLNTINNNYNNGNCYYQNGYYNCNNQNSPNLTITSIEAGKMINNSFSPQTNFVYGDRIALRVRVRNNGGSFTNTWSTRTTYSDTTGSNRNVVTDNERYLSSGEETVLTIQTSDTLNRGTTILNFGVDTNNTLYETNEGDNNASVSVYVY